MHEKNILDVIQLCMYIKLGKIIKIGGITITVHIHNDTLFHRPGPNRKIPVLKLRLLNENGNGIETEILI